jgi:hypothetical protein
MVWWLQLQLIREVPGSKPSDYPVAGKVRGRQMEDENWIAHDVIFDHNDQFQLVQYRFIHSSSGGLAWYLQREYLPWWWRQ